MLKNQPVSSLGTPTTLDSKRHKLRDSPSILIISNANGLRLGVNRGTSGTLAGEG